MIPTFAKRNRQRVCQMKNAFLLLLIFAHICAQGQINPPIAVSNAFSKKFPDGRHVKWEKENAKLYEAVFELKGRKMSANFDMQGNWKETESEIDIIDLPGVVARSIAEKYRGAVISAANKIERPGSRIIYEADITMKGEKMEIELFADGKWVK